MRKNVLFVVALALIFVAAPALANTNALPVTSTPTQAQSQAQNQDQVQTFTGKIAKSGDKFVLVDQTGQGSFDLDDQQRASQYEGKKVKITGTLDQAKGMIHVQSIESVA